MKAHTKEWAGLQHSSYFLFCSDDNAIAAQLGAALGELGMVTQEVPPQERLAARLAEISPRLVFLDFTLDPESPGKLLRTADLAKTLARVAPTLPRIAVGSIAQPESAIAALRAGVTDFVDLHRDSGEILEVVNSILTLSNSPTGGQSPTAVKRSVLLIGARPGVGTSTMAVHLAGMLQDRMTHAAQSRFAGTSGVQLPLSERVALMDLGWPIGDCQLYMNVDSEFNFVEAARQLRRMDPTLLSSAMAHARNGVSLLSLPKDMAEMRHVSQPDSLLLFERLRENFGMVVADAGGFNHPEFVSGLARSAGETWLVTDQSVGALVSLAGMIKELESHHVDLSQLKLVVNRYDERYGMTAQQIADRFNLPLVGTLPERSLALIVCTNQGKLLHEVADRDAYVRAMSTLVESVVAEPAPTQARSGWLAAWLPNVHRRLMPH